MTQSVIARDDLKQLVLTNPQRPDARLVTLLTRWKSPLLTIKVVQTNDLRRIYERRRQRLPDAHPLSASVNTLLTALAAYDESEVGVVTLEGDAEIASLWLSRASDALLASLYESSTA